MTKTTQKVLENGALARAIELHQAGQHAQAEALYLEALEARPTDPQILYLLGAVKYERKQFDQAKDFLEKSLSRRPGHTPTQSMLGALYATVGEPEKAIEYLRAVVAATPSSADAFYNLGRALLACQKYSESSKAFESSLALRPDQLKTLDSLAASLKGEGRVDAAVAIWRDCIARFVSDTRAYIALGKHYLATKQDEDAAEILSACLVQDPNCLDALLLLGNLRHRQVFLDEAEILFRRLVALKPKYAAANNYLGAVLLALGRLDEAEPCVRKAYALDPDDPEVLTNLGLVLDNRGRSDEAQSLHERATQLKPTMPEAWNNLGISQQNCGRVEQALQSYAQAVAVKPSFYGAKTNSAHALLALGRLAEGWKEYGHRFDQKFMASKRRVFPYPMWTGMPDRSARLLLWTDQGLGDEVLYTSMLQDAVARVGSCILECYPSVVPLFQRSFPDITVVGRSKIPDPKIGELKPDFQLSLIELGTFFRPTISSIPSHKGYLQPDHSLRATLRAKYEAKANGKRIVGISWKSDNPIAGHFKTIALNRWAEIFGAHNVHFVSLQYGRVEEDIAKVSADLGAIVFHDKDIDPLKNPDASAAQISAMDLVITTSNTTAHFAGGLNVPVWTLIPTGAGIFWYWFLNRSDSPWYPSMRLYRQQKPGDWSQPLSEVAQSLRQWASS